MPYGVGEYTYSNNGLAAADYTSDGNIDFSGNPVAVDYDPGYGGVWNFNDFDSGVRLGEGTVTPVAVYATWVAQSQWESDARYTITGTADGSPHQVKNINQTAPPGNDSPVPNDRPWKLLGVYDVNVGSTLTVTLCYDTPDGGEDPTHDAPLCISDVMIHPLWPTVSIRPTNVTVNPMAANYNDYVDWVDACNPISVPVEDGQGDRTELQLEASISPLYYDIPGANPNDWTAVLPSVTGLEFWSDSEGGTQLPPGGIGNVIDQPLSGGSYTGTVYVSVDPSSSLAAGEANGSPVTTVVAEVQGPHGEQIQCMLPVQAATSSWTRNPWSGSPATSNYSGNATAHGNNATLRQLAADITGNASDYSLLIKANPGIKMNTRTTAVPADTKINIAPLLQKLETTLRSNVAAAATGGVYATFPKDDEEFSEGSDMDEAEVNAVFKYGNTGCFDCLGMATVLMARGLIKALKPGEFDAIFGTTDDIPYVKPTVPLSATKKGDWLYFANDPDYDSGFYQGENVIETQHGPKIPLSRFAGWTGDKKKGMWNLSYSSWCAGLVRAYNHQTPPPATKIKTVPGYTGTAEFFNVAKVAQMIFDFRTKSTDRNS